MAHWLYTVELGDDWKQADNGELNIAQLSAIVSGKLKALPPYRHDAELIAIVDEFDELAGEPQSDADDFNNTLARLYDWGDTLLSGGWNGTKQCFINTFRKPSLSFTRDAQPETVA